MIKPNKSMALCDLLAEFKHFAMRLYKTSFEWEQNIFVAPNNDLGSKRQTMNKMVCFLSINLVDSF